MAINYFSFNSTSTSFTAFTGAVTLRGYSFSATANAEVIIRDGVNDSGTMIIPLYLLTTQSTNEYFNLEGIQFTSGIRVTIVSGTVKGAIWYT